MASCQRPLLPKVDILVNDDLLDQLKEALDQRDTSGRLYIISALVFNGLTSAVAHCDQERMQLSRWIPSADRALDRKAAVQEVIWPGAAHACMAEFAGRRTAETPDQSTKAQSPLRLSPASHAVRVMIQHAIKHWVICHFKAGPNGHAILYDTLYQATEIEERHATLLFMFSQICDFWPQFCSVPMERAFVKADTQQQPKYSSYCGICCMM